MLKLFLHVIACASVSSGIKKKSKVPGVMITQFLEELPEGMSTPDFTRKPIALTIQEGQSSGISVKLENVTKELLEHSVKQNHLPVCFIDLDVR